MLDDVTVPERRTSWAFTNHPAFQLASLLIGILGVVLACFFYFRGQRERKPLYVVQPTRNIVVNRALAVGKRITVLYDGQSLEAQNVTTLQCTFWNAGGEPIKGSDVLIPIRLSLPKDTEILDISVIKQSRPSIINFTAATEKGSKGERTNTATLNFTILEKGDGATLQLVYVGTPEVPVTISGTVVGAEVAAVRTPLDFGRKSNGDAKSEARLLKATLLVYLFMPFIAVPLPVIIRRLLNNRTAKPTTSFRLLTSRRFWILQGFWALLILAGYYYLFYRYPEVPIGLL
jgi:hypothetical protein